MYSNSKVSNLLRRMSRGPRPELAREQAQVARASHGDSQAAEILLLDNLSYVVHIAKEFGGCGVAFEDLISEGCVGLLKAIRGYSATSGTRFMSYAWFWVRKEMLAAIEVQPHLIQVPAYARRHGFDTIRVLHFDVRRNADGNPILEEGLRHPDPLPREAIIANEKTVELHRYLLRLAPRDQVVLVWRYGLGGKPAQTLREVSHRLGVSRERVRQIEVAALLQLRKALRDRSRTAAGFRAAFDSGSARAPKRASQSGRTRSTTPISVPVQV